MKDLNYVDFHTFARQVLSNNKELCEPLLPFKILDVGVGISKTF